MTEEREEERLREERSAMCSEHKVFEDLEACRVWLWFPQLGGYGGHANISFSKITGQGEGGPGCFEVDLYHDGEWPKNHVCFSWHACSALQWVRFGLDVYEQQLRYQTLDTEDAPVLPDLDELKRLRDRIDGIIEMYESPAESTP